jgi:hypothetical protein
MSNNLYSFSGHSHHPSPNIHTSYREPIGASTNYPGHLSSSAYLKTPASHEFQSLSQAQPRYSQVIHNLDQSRRLSPTYQPRHTSPTYPRQLSPSRSTYINTNLQSSPNRAYSHRAYSPTRQTMNSQPIQYINQSQIITGAQSHMHSQVNMHSQAHAPKVIIQGSHQSTQNALYETIEQFLKQISGFYNTDKNGLVRGLNSKEVWEVMANEKEFEGIIINNLQAEKAKVSDGVDGFLKEVIEIGENIKMSLFLQLDNCLDQFRGLYSQYNRDLLNFCENSKQILLEEQTKHASEQFGSDYHGDDPLEEEIKIFNMKNHQAKCIQDTFMKIKDVRENYGLENQAALLKRAVENSSIVIDFG